MNTTNESGQQDDRSSELRSKRGLVYWHEGSGQRVLMVMGFAMPGRSWENQSAYLRQFYHVAYFDNRGIGESSPVAPSGHSMAVMVGDTLSVMDALGWEDAHIIGVSMGGMIAQHLALQYPKRVRSLSLVATSAGGLFAPRPRLQGARLFLQAFRAKKPEQRAKVIKSLLFPKEYLRNIDQTLHDKLNDSFQTRAPRKTARAQLRAVFGHDTQKQLKDIDVPVLIVKPELDILIHPRESERLHRFMPHSQILRLKDAGHGVIRQCAKELNEAIHEHIKRADAAR